MRALKNIVLPATLFYLVLAVVVVLNKGGLTEDNIRQIIRITAASSMLLFSLTFTASSLLHFFCNEYWQSLMQARRRLGLSFALSHTVHLFAIVALVEIAYGGDYFQLGDIAGGSVIYLFIFAMAATSNDASVKLLGAKNWKKLHKTGSYLIWTGLFSVYLENALETGALHYWLCVPLCISLIAVRVGAFWDKRINA